MKGAANPSDREPDPRPGGSTSPSLIDRARGGEEAAWAQLEFVYRPLVQRWCRRHGVDKPQDVEDVTQEVFGTVFTKFAGFTRGAPGSFRSWLYTITRLKALDHYRRNRDEPGAAGGSDARDRLQDVADALGEGSTADEAESERTLLIRRALELIRPEFKPKTWEAVSRVLLEEEPSADVAAGLGLSIGAVYTAKSRVLSRLREVLEDLQL